MKTIFISMLFLYCNIVFPQTASPENYSKIKFVYEQTSNFYIENDQLFADTLLLKMEFPKIKFSKTLSPLDSTKTIGLVNIKTLRGDDNRKLGNILYHSTHIIEGTYDKIEQKTTLYYERVNSASNEILRSYFKDNYPPFSFNVIVDYLKNKIYTNYPSVNYEETFESKMNKITFLNEEKTVGFYSFENKKGFNTEEIVLNKKYSNKITPPIIFSNNDFAVDKIISLRDTIKLISVTYE
jgi:hypothetical protein